MLTEVSTPYPEEISALLGIKYPLAREFVVGLTLFLSKAKNMFPLCWRSQVCYGPQINSKSSRT